MMTSTLKSTFVLKFHRPAVMCQDTRNNLFSTSSSLPAEDEQRNSLSSQKALHAVTMEKEAALADLNSVERSLSDVFRRYENMKSTLEGFKKVRSPRANCCLDDF